MNAKQHLLCLALAATVGACQAPKAAEPERGLNDMWAGAELRQTAMRQAILAQGSLYPYHFVVDRAELNELGAHDLDVLAEGQRDLPGQLCVRRGQASDKLYAARLEAVRAGLRERGVDVVRVALVEELESESQTWSGTVRGRAERAASSAGQGGSMASFTQGGAR